MKLAAMLVLLLLAMGLGLLGGERFFLPQDLFGNLSATDQHVLYQLRLVRVLKAAGIGAILGLSGLLLQASLHNPLASPFTLGTSAGASFGAMLGLTLIGPALMTSQWGLAIWALGGALCVTIPVILVSLKRNIPAEAVLLTGVAFSFAALALTSGMHYLASNQTAGSYLRWSLGNLGGTGDSGWRELSILILPSLVLLLVVAWPLRWRIEAMLMGEEIARARGVSTSRVRALVVVGVALAVAASVAACGPIGFIGLVIPHVAAGMVGASTVKRFWMVTILGATTLVFCDFVGQHLLSGVDIPIGVVTAGIGTPAFIVLLARRFRREDA